MTGSRSARSGSRPRGSVAASAGGPLPRSARSGNVGATPARLEANVSPILAIWSDLGSELEESDGDELYVPLNGKLDPALTIVGDEVAVPLDDLVGDALGARGALAAERPRARAPPLPLPVPVPVPVPPRPSDRDGDRPRVAQRAVRPVTACSRRTLWHMQTSPHSPRAFSIPRIENRLNPMACLIWPNTGSGRHFRRR
jgi:hypothetical protein